MRSSVTRSALFSAFLMLILVVAVSASPQAAANPTQVDSVRWVTYVDPRFDFSIRYPSDWQVIPRDDSDPAALSGLLTFVPIATSEDASLGRNGGVLNPQITVGLYLAEREIGQSLSEWTELYESASSIVDGVLTQRQPRQSFRVHGVTAIHEEGISPITSYQFTNLSRYRSVWFIWTNIPSNSDSAYSNVYRRMTRTFRSGLGTPATLKDAYGDNFESLDLERIVREDVLGTEGRTPTEDVEDRNLSSSWLSPVLNKTNGNHWNVQCGSDLHTGTSAYAADIGVGVGNKVYSAKAGIVTFAGQDNSSYGNLIQIKASGGKEAYYAHLKSIYVMPGAYVSSPSQIALSGESGGVDPHLHFHVRYGNAAEDLDGMSGFYPNDDWPSDEDVSCGQMGR